MNQSRHTKITERKKRNLIFVGNITQDNDKVLHVIHIIIRFKLFFLQVIGRKPTTWPANNCLQIMVCSCTMSSNCVWLCVWLQIIFCSCVNETTLLFFLRSLLRENGRSLRFPNIFIKKQTWWSNDKTIFRLSNVFTTTFLKSIQLKLKVIILQQNIKL